MRPDILNFLFSPLSNIKGIGEKTLKNYTRLLSKKKTLKDDNIKILDLLFHLPDKILERKLVDNINEISNDEYIVAKLHVVTLSPPTKSKQPYIITCYLGKNFVNVVYYKYFENYINNKFRVGSEVFVSGKVVIYNSQIQIVHPDYISNNLDDIPFYESIYPLTYGITNKELSKNIDFILKNCPDLQEWLTDDIIGDWSSWSDSLKALHKPNSNFDMKNNKFRDRLVFDEFLAQQIALKITKKDRDFKEHLNCTDKILKNRFIQNFIPFKLTKDQEKVIAEIEEDTFSNQKMTRLLQGDVGSGKTIVAFITMLNYIDNNKQCVLMAPTSILANQHFENIKKFCEELGLKVELLTGKIKGKKRKEILENLENGEINILVGTHALIEDNVGFKDLGYVVIDEQHRFGVEQRLMLTNKNENADILAMSATPIPRTLALTIYNDMSLSIIQEKPKDRKEIITLIIEMSQYNTLIEKIKQKKDEKVYWICPLVDENEESNLTDVKNKYKEFCSIFGEEKVSFIHGKLKDKDEVMEDFCNNNERKILIATTVIEVGVDIKDATIIVIEHPERFGLSQLHQLRGRVGRGDKQSYCILLYDNRNIGKNTVKRLNIMKSSSNGFVIAEQDLKIRGIGEVLGLKQSGQQDYIIADLDTDFPLFERAIYYSQYILKENKVQDFSLLLYLFGYTDFINKGILNS